jgi:hypothetical protein
MNTQEELRGFIDNDQFVSFRWFANCLDINVEKAKGILQKFKDTNEDVFATYCISGQLKNKQRSMTIVPENFLVKCKEQFSVVDCIHVYSLQKSKFEQSLTVSAQLRAADLQQANELIVQQPLCLSFLLNEVGGIRLEGSDVKKIGKRVAPTVRVISGSNGSAEGQMAKSFSKAATGKIATSSSSKDTSNDKAKDRQKDSIASSFFGKAAAPAAKTNAKAKKDSKDTKDTKEIKETKETASPATSKEKAKKDTKKDVEKATEIVDDENDEWVEEGALPTSYKLDKKRLLKKNQIPATAAETEPG